MAERRATNKSYPPEWDPSTLASDLRPGMAVAPATVTVKPPAGPGATPEVVVIEVAGSEIGEDRRLHVIEESAPLVVREDEQAVLPVLARA